MKQQLNSLQVYRQQKLKTQETKKKPICNFYEHLETRKLRP